MWEQIRSNKRRSAMLVLFIALLLFVLGFLIGESVQPGGGLTGLAVAAFIWLVMSLVAYFQGDRILLAVSGAREISKEDHPRLFNVVEEMKIASGLPAMPRIYIIDDMALNAFATGRKPENAAVAVTAGLLGRLNRDQLQGVIAHEISHVVNRDVLLMSMVGVLLGAIVMISDLFLRSLWYSGRTRRYRSSSKGGQGQGLFLVLALVLAILAPILAQLIYLAISRRREYLADAGSAVLTRYPEGLASALETIAADTQPLAHANKATAPMYISNPFRGVRSVGLTSTHPPIEQRIRILRSMAGGVSFPLYDAAWRQVRGSRSGVLPRSALAQAEQHGVRPPQPSEDEAPADPRQRMREAGDVLLRLNQFAFLPCACGVKLKIPPDFKQDKVRCPRCQRVLDVPLAGLAAAAAAGRVLTRDDRGPHP